MSSDLVHITPEVIPPTRQSHEIMTSCPVNYATQVIEHRQMPGGMEAARDVAEHMQANGEGVILDQFGNPDNPLAHNNLGSALAGRGQLSKAIAEYRRALEIKPDYSAAHDNLAMALQRQGPSTPLRRT